MRTINKTFKWGFGILAVLFAAQVTLVAANYKLADKTGASMASFRDEIVNVSKEVDAAMAALDKVLVDAATNPRKAYEQFSKAVPRVEAASKKAKSRAQSMRARGEAYFKDWEKEMTAVNNPEIKKLANERKAELQEGFNNIKSVMDPVTQQFNDWLSDLKDLDKYLSNDLTVNGIHAAKSLIAETRTGGQEVQESMDKVIDELNSIVAAITPAKVKPVKK